MRNRSARRSGFLYRCSHFEGVEGLQIVVGVAAVKTRRLLSNRCSVVGIQSMFLPLMVSVTAKCDIAVVAAAPCQ